MPREATIVKPLKKGQRVGKKATKQDLSTFSGRMGALIRARREKLGISIAELATAADVGEQTIYAWEIGRNTININALPDIAAKLATTAKKLTPDE